MKYFKKIHLLIIMTCIIVVSPPARATYQDSIILQYLIAQYNYIMEYVNEVGFALQHLTKQLGNMSVSNAHQQDAEVQSGVIAENVKTLGNLKYKLEFGGSISSSSHNQKKYWVSAVSSVGCAIKDFNHVSEGSEKIAGLLNNDMQMQSENFKIYDGSIEEQRLEDKRVAIEYANNAKAPVLSPGNNIAMEEAQVAAEAIEVTINKRVFPKDHGHSGTEVGGGSSVDYYRQLTETISKIVTNNYTKGVSINSEGSVANNNKVKSDLRMTDNYIFANNMKTQKGAAFDIVEGSYSLLQIKLEQLDELRQQEKLHLIRALTSLRKFHQEDLL